LTSGKIGYGRDKPSDSELDSSSGASYIPHDRLELLSRAMSNNNSNGKQETLLKWNDSGAESYVILPQFKENDGENGEDYDDDDGDEDETELTGKALSNRMKSLSTIFNILSSKSDFDYPVCKDCAQLLLSGMKSQYDKSAHEREIYLQFLQKLESRQTPLVSKTEESLQEIDKLKEQEQILLSELQKLEDEKDNLDSEILDVERELQEIDTEEFELLKLENKRELEEREFIKERDTIKAEYEFNLRQLDNLRKTNVYNDTFNISHEGPFGTINGLRLGSLDNVRVPWQEINAALGQVVLLIATVSSRLNIKLDGYRLKPMGSTSKIDKIERDLSNPDKPTITTFEVYSSGEYQIERFFSHSKLDNSLVSILDIVSQIEKKLKEFDSSIDLPYKMVKDKIGGASIKLSSKLADEEWTGACKFLLTNLKWILAYSSAHAPKSSNRWSVHG
jgi:beclin 1